MNSKQRQTRDYELEATAYSSLWIRSYGKLVIMNWRQRQTTAAVAEEETRAHARQHACMYIAARHPMRVPASHPNGGQIQTAGEAGACCFLVRELLAGVLPETTLTAGGAES